MTRARDLSRLGNRNAITASSTNNIGIGSTIPDTKLDVVGDVFVTGVVTATNYYGDGSTLTGIGQTVDVRTNSLVVSGVSTFSGAVGFDTHVDLPDNARLRLGDSDDLQIYHDGTNSYILENGTGDLGIRGDNNFFIQNAAGTENKAKFYSNGAVELYYDNANKFQTISTGATVTGDLYATTLYGDGSNLTGIAAGGGSGDFNTGITTTIVGTPVGVGTTVLTLPATAGEQYVVSSIFVSNVASGSTEINVIGSFDFDTGYGGGERSYFAYNIPVPPGTSVELLEQPQVLGPSDQILLRSTDYNRNGVDDGLKAFITYESQTSTEYFGVGVSTTGLGTTDPVGIYTSSTYPSVIQSIRLVNRTDDGDYPVTVSTTNGIVTTNLVENLVIPKYASVEIMDKQKRIGVNDVIKVEVGQIETIAVQISGKQITA
jgi:hypothetical protein